MLWHRLRAPGLLALCAMLLVPLVMMSAGPAAADPAPGEGEVPATAYSAAGEEVEGAASMAGAPTIAPGAHRDTFAAGEVGDEPGTAKHYRIAVEPGQRVHVGATIAAPPYPDGLPEEREQLGLSLSLRSASGKRCGDSTTSTGQEGTGDGPITATITSLPAGEDTCTGEAMFLTVTRTGTRAAEQALPVEIQSAVQMPGLEDGSPLVQEVIDDDGASPVAPADSEPVQPGRSLAAPLEVEPGSVVVELVPGETAVLGVDVEQGQRLRWRTEVLEAPERPGSVALTVQNPAREPVRSGNGDLSLGDVGAVTGGGMVAPVSTENLASDEKPIASAWLPGTQTVMLRRAQRAADDDPAGAAPVRLVLTLEVDGQAQEPADAVAELGDPQPGAVEAQGPLRRIVLIGGAALLGLVGLAAVVSGGWLLASHRRRPARS